MMIILLWFYIHIHLYHLVPGLVASLPACVCVEQPRDGSISFNFCLSICFSLQARNLAASAHLLHIIFNVNVIVCKSVSVLFSDRLSSVLFGLLWFGLRPQSAFSFHFTPFQLSKWNDIIIIFFGVLGLWSSSSCNSVLQICNFPSGSDVMTVITRRSLAAVTVIIIVITTD